MFKVQEYLKSGKSLEDLTNEYFIKCNICSELGIVSLNYNQINGDMSLDICQECRGLILELDTWNVISRSFKKFSNLDEPNAEKTKNIFNWGNYKALIKLDGSLICLYYYKNQWNIATRGFADANCPVEGHDITFRELVLSTMEKINFCFDKLDPKIWYSFELTTPLNKQVVQYKDYKLTWLAAWDRNGEIDIDILSDIGIPKVEKFPINDLDSLIIEINKLSPLEFEGIVLVDNNFNRLKIKTDDYKMAFHAVNYAQSSPRNKLELLLSDKFDDIYGILPGELLEELIIIKNNWNKMISYIGEIYNKYKDIDNQKKFAFEVKDFYFKSWLFCLRKGMTMDEIIEKSFIDTKLEYLRKFVDGD